MEQFERYARTLSFARKSVPTKQNFGCLVVHRRRINVSATNGLASEHPSCSQHAEMAVIHDHMKQLKLWDQFLHLLRKSYVFTNGTFGRVEGKASFRTTSALCSSIAIPCFSNSSASSFAHSMPALHFSILAKRS